jgi:NitT/TauT family transport system permease protein
MRRTVMPDAARKGLLLVVLAAAWEIYARTLDNALLFPTFSATVSALASSIASGELPRAAVHTLTLLMKGYLSGLALAVLLTAFASASRIGADLLELLTSMF